VYGPIRQLSYVVTDIDEAMRYWQDSYSVGPFLVARDEIPLQNAFYRGQRSEQVKVNIAFAYIGSMQLELTQLVGSTPSLYQEALDRGISGVHHYAVCVDNFASAYNYALDNGYETVVDSGFDGLARMSYVENTSEGLILEVIEWNSLTKPYFDEIEKRCKDADEKQLVHEFKLSQLVPVLPILTQLGKFLFRKLTGQVTKTMRV